MVKKLMKSKVKSHVYSLLCPKRSQNLATPTLEKDLLQAYNQTLTLCVEKTSKFMKKTQKEKLS